VYLLSIFIRWKVVRFAPLPFRRRAVGRYKVPKELKIFRTVNSPLDLSVRLPQQPPKPSQRKHRQKTAAFAAHDPI
jgi:hypothetical protein